MIFVFQDAWVQALWLQKRPGLEVMVANPRAVRHFAHALLERSTSDPLWQQRFQQLDSIPGLGATSAVALLAELNLLAAGLDVRQGVALAGNRHRRRALYLPALVAVRHDPHLRAVRISMASREVYTIAQAALKGGKKKGGNFVSHPLSKTGFTGPAELSLAFAETRLHTWGNRFREQ